MRLDSPAWSRDGRRIALVGCCDVREGENGGLFSVVATMRPDGSDVRQVFLADGAMNPAWTRDGRVVFSDGLDLLTTGRLGGKPERYFAQGGGYVSGPAWSPQGGRLALESVRGIRITNARGEGGTFIGEGSNPSWSPDRERIAVEDGSGGISVVTIATREFESVLPDDGAGDVSKGQPAWSPDGGTIAYSYADQDGFGRLALYDVAARRSRTTAFQLFGHIDWRPDGNAVAYAAPKTCSASVCTNIRVFDLRSRRSRLLIQNAASPAWSPDGRWIAFVRRVRGTQKIFVARASGAGARQLTRGAGGDAEPAWQPLPR
jgi:Tol biopolymer transport system component